MQCTTENKIRQTMKLELDKASVLQAQLHEKILTFVERVNEQKIEGQLEALKVYINYHGDTEIEIQTVKEDRLKLLQEKTIEG